jgi:hypothetical protein
VNNKQINLPNLFAESKTLITLVITASLAAVFVILIEDTFGVAAAIFGSIALILAAHILNNAAKMRIDTYKKDINQPYESNKSNQFNKSNQSNQSNQSVKPNNNNFN